MKIGFISDSHLGYKSGKKTTEDGINIREQDGYNALKECIDGFIEEKVDYVVIGGDLFHSPKPSIKTIVNTRNELMRLAEHKIPTYIITGNHDIADISHDYSSILSVDTPQLGIYCYDSPLEIVDLNDRVRLWMVSHQSMEEQEKTFNQIKLDKDKINILVTHGSCYDDNLGIVLKTALEPREVVIPEKILRMDWDYTFMGHIHERGWVHSKDGKTDTENRKQFYGGSLIRRGFSDKECPLGRGYTIININEDTKEIELDLHNIWQRTQASIDINCIGKTSEDILNETVSCLEEVTQHDLPIVRIRFYGINNIQRKEIDWSSVNQFEPLCLKLDISFNYSEVITDNSITYETGTQMGNILIDYESFWEVEKQNVQESILEDTKEKIKEFLEQGIEENLKDER